MVKHDTERGSNGEGLAELEDEASSEDRVSSEVEEGLVEGDLGGRRGEETEPYVVDRLLGGSELLRVACRGGGDGSGGGDGVGEGERGLVDLAIGVERHASERDEDYEGE